MSDYNQNIISLYFTRHTSRGKIQDFMNQTGVTEWYIYNDKTTGLPMLFLKNSNDCLAIEECTSICYDYVNNRFFIGQPTLAQTAPYSLVTLGVVGAICYAIYCWFF